MLEMIYEGDQTLIRVNPSWNDETTLTFRNDFSETHTWYTADGPNRDCKLELLTGQWGTIELSTIAFVATVKEVVQI